MRSFTSPVCVCQNCSKKPFLFTEFLQGKNFGGKSVIGNKVTLTSDSSQVRLLSYWSGKRPGRSGKRVSFVSIFIFLA